jgi:hypothetical protein
MPSAKNPARAKVAGTEIIRVKSERAIEMLQRHLPVAARAVNFCQCMVAGGGPSLIPSGFVECVVSFVITTEVTQGQAEVIQRFAIVRVAIATGEPFNGFAKMAFGLGKFAAPEMPETNRVIATGIERVTPQRLAPVKRRTARGVTVLLQMQASDEQRIVAFDFFW